MGAMGEVSRNSSVRIVLVDIDHPERGFERMIPPDMIIGRIQDQDVNLSFSDEPSVSRRHCRIFYDKAGNHGRGGVYIEDLHSTNHTFVQGREVREKTMLNNKDIIVLGQLRLRIFIEIQECTMAVPASIPQDAGDSRGTEGEEYAAAPSPDYSENDFYEVQGAGRSHTMSRGLRIAIWSIVFYFLMDGIALILSLAEYHLGPDNLIIRALFVPCAIAAICVLVIGWRMINRIQPVMFLWMPMVGWIFYFTFKSVLAILVGSFVAPYRLAVKWVDSH
ncbi:FHA domain-containing protein [Clostridium vitabionis]|uniref:FHA domain-containing protein n=1 Tax=Clostridium vitabionis TaxID=2784388 RepID=UPI00188B0FB6|nr:FHA domain-containing protein [Clostridium vitabionis]